MNFQLSQTSDSSLIQIDGAVDIASAADLKAALLEAIKQGKEIHVSAEKAGDLDITAYQLLWAARRDAELAGIGFALTGVPESVQSAWKDMGLERLTISG
jgi:anti-anti-sigma regulatory factor